MNEYTLYGRAVIGGKVIEKAAITVCDGVITACGERGEITPRGSETDHGNLLLVPGYIDIHCHAGGEVWMYDDVASAVKYHMAHGTTSMCCTLYRDLGIDGMLAAIQKVKDEMKRCGAIIGVHLEGPYLNPSLGSKLAGGTVIARREEYMPLIETGVLRHMTYSPEVEGTDVLMQDLAAAGIKGSIGHSAASPDEVRRARANGASIVTHLFDATGASVSPTRWGGTIETDFNVAALVCDGFDYEIICDSGCVHVRADMIRLVKAAVGAGRIIGITDACGGKGDGSDVNFEDGELMGSKLTMDRVARNFASLGFTEAEVVKVTAENPARALGLLDTRGEIAPGKAADILAVNGSWSPEKVYTQKKYN